ncbi:hypothetical protein IAR50_000144 [Cryptococcus sp. DSM 104548]
MSANGAVPVPPRGLPTALSDAEITKAFEVLINTLDTSLAAFTRKDDASRHLVKLCSFPDADPCHPAFDSARRAAKESKQQHEAALASARAAFQELVWLMIAKAGGSGAAIVAPPALPVSGVTDSQKALAEHKKTLEDQFSSGNTALEGKLAQQLAQRFEAFQKTIKAETDADRQNYEMEADALRGMMSEVKSVKAIFEEGMDKIKSLEKWREEREQAEALKASEARAAAELAAHADPTSNLPTPNTAQSLPSHPKPPTALLSRLAKEEMVDRLDFLENEVAMQREEIDEIESIRRRKRKRTDDDEGEKGKAAKGQKVVPGDKEGQDQLWAEVRRLQEELQKLKTPAESVPPPGQTSAPSSAAQPGSASPTHAPNSGTISQYSTLLRTITHLQEADPITQNKLKALVEADEARKAEIAKLNQLHSRIEGWEQNVKALVSQCGAEFSGQLLALKTDAAMSQAVLNTKLGELGEVVQQVRSALDPNVPGSVAKALQDLDTSNGTALSGVYTQLNNLQADLQHHAAFLAALSGQGDEPSITESVDTISEVVLKCLRVSTGVVSNLIEMKAGLKGDKNDRVTEREGFLAEVRDRIKPEAEVGGLEERIGALERPLKQRMEKEDQTSFLQTQLDSLQKQLQAISQSGPSSTNLNTQAQTEQADATRNLAQQLKERAKQLDIEKAEQEVAEKDKEALAKREKEMQDREEALFERCMTKAREEMEKSVAAMVKRELKAIQEASRARIKQHSQTTTPVASPRVGNGSTPAQNKDMDIDAEDRPKTPSVSPPARSPVDNSAQPSKVVKPAEAVAKRGAQQTVQSSTSSPASHQGQTHPRPSTDSPLSISSPPSASTSRPSSAGGGSSNPTSAARMTQFFHNADRTGVLGDQVDEGNITPVTQPQTKWKRSATWTPTPQNRADARVSAPRLNLSNQNSPTSVASPPPTSIAIKTTAAGDANARAKSGLALPSGRQSTGFALPQGSTLPAPRPGAIPSKPPVPLPENLRGFRSPKSRDDRGLPADEWQTERDRRPWNDR